MKRAKRLTRKQRQAANKVARELAAQKPRKTPGKTTTYRWALTTYLELQAKRKEAKKLARQHKHEHDHDHDHEHEPETEEKVEE